MLPKTDFSFTLSEWWNPDYVSHGQSIDSDSASAQYKKDTWTVSPFLPRTSLVIWSKDPPQNHRPAPSQWALDYGYEYNLNYGHTWFWLSIPLFRFLSHSRFSIFRSLSERTSCILYALCMEKDSLLALFHCCKINQNVCKI